MSATLWVTPRDRQRDEQFFRRYLRPGDTLIDVGANIGTLSIIGALTVGPTGRVVAVEAHPRTATFLRGNIALNRLTNIEVRLCALGTRTGTAQLTNGRSDDQNRMTTDGGVEVPLRRLDDLELPAGEISLLKIDVEGYELPVLQGGGGVLERTQCVYFESWDRHFSAFGYSTGDVLALLAGAGFTCLQRLDATSLRVLSLDYRSSQCEDLVAVRSIPRFCQRTGWAVSA
jgi:FkbM family methyltransferase